MVVDGHSCHKQDLVKRILKDNKVVLVFSLAYASFLVQPCDKGVFYVLKKELPGMVRKYMKKWAPGSSGKTRTSLRFLLSGFRDAWQKVDH